MPVAPVRARRRLFVAPWVAASVVAGALLATAVTSQQPSDESPRAVRATTTPTSTAPGPPATTATTSAPSVQIEDRSYSRGECVTWLRADVPEPARTVDCATPHFLEMTGMTVAVPGRSYPSEEEWSDLTERACLPVVERYLGLAFDPYGRYVVLGMHPGLDPWVRGDRYVDCAIGYHPLLSPEPHHPFTGRVDPTSQSFLYPIASCLVETTDGTVPVDCTTPHRHQVTGWVDAGKWVDRYGALADSHWVDRECRAHAEAYLGHPLHLPLASSSLVLERASWNAGSRGVNCVVNRVDGLPMRALLRPDGSAR
jgi:hypothetical protein